MGMAIRRPPATQRPAAARPATVRPAPSERGPRIAPAPSGRAAAAGAPPADEAPRVAPVADRFDRAAAPRLPEGAPVLAPPLADATAAAGLPPPSRGLIEADVRQGLRRGDVFLLEAQGLPEPDAAFLRSVGEALVKFRKRPPEIAASLQGFRLGDQSPDALHDLLLARGFAHERMPLFGRPQPRIVDRVEGRPVFEKRDGTRTQDPRDPGVVLDPTHVRRDGSLARSPEGPDLVMQDLYVHPDGGMVRVKREGDPSSLVRPEPHASRSVLLRPSDPKAGYDVRRDSGWANEGFKVDEEGNPGPKAPTPACGMRAPRPPHAQLATRAEDYAGAYTDALMAAVHVNLPSPAEAS